MTVHDPFTVKIDARRWLVSCTCGADLGEITETELDDGLDQRLHAWHTRRWARPVLCPARAPGAVDGHLCQLPYPHAGADHRFSA